VAPDTALAKLSPIMPRGVVGPVAFPVSHHPRAPAAVMSPPSCLLRPSCPCSLDLRQERQRGVAMGTVDRGLLWFDADRTPASEIPGLPGVDAMGDRTRGDTRNPLGTGSTRAAQGHRPGIPDEPRDPAHRGATT
jgi:hypothetical protein